ncbi:MAG: pyridoxal phosphate-dependent decarboxylase family protein [Phycisphaerales bacterium JB059]
MTDKSQPLPSVPPTGDLVESLTRAAEWGAAYLASLSQRPVQSRLEPGDLLDRLPATPPEHSPEHPQREWDAIYRDLDNLILPSLTHWQSPSFFAFFPCNQSAPTIVAELLSAILNVNGMNWATSPGVTELEIRTLDWMAHAMGLPDGFRSDAPDGGGVIQSTASDATLVALLAARQRARRLHPDDPDVDTRLCVYTSSQAHSSVVKAAMIAGLARAPDDDRRLRLIPTDPDLRMDVDALGRAMREDVDRGLLPAFIGATLGTTSSGAFDPLAPICDAADQAPVRPWVHVDAAWAGAALVCPELREPMRPGLERADSLCVNPHKWLLTNFDCDLMWTRSARDLVDALSITPEYLRHESQLAGAVDFRDWQVPLGRRFRSLKLWLLLRMFGIEGLRAHIRGGVRWAEELEGWVRADDRFEVAAPRSLSLLCVRLRAGDAPTKALLDRVNASGRAYLSHTTLPDGEGSARYVIRIAIGGTHTRREHVEGLWALLRDEADAVLRSTP